MGESDARDSQLLIFPNQSAARIFTAATSILKAGAPAAESYNHRGSSSA